MSSSSDSTIATYTNIPNYILMYLFKQKRSDLSRTALKLYLYLRSKKNNQSGIAWPGTNTIISEAHVSRKDIKPARDQLVVTGLLSVLSIKGPRGTVMVDFNDEKIKRTSSPKGKRVSSSPKGKRRSSPKGKRTSSPKGNTTITSTNTSVTITKGKSKSKKKKDTGTVRLSPDAPTPERKGAVPLRGTTIRPTKVQPVSAEEVRQRQAAWNTKQGK